MDGNTALGASSPAKPAFTRPEPLSHTRAVVSSSSHMVSGFCKDGKAVETLGVSGGRPRHRERPPSPGAYGHPQPPARRRPEGEAINATRAELRYRALRWGETTPSVSPSGNPGHTVPEGSLPWVQAPPSPHLRGLT